MLYFYNYYWIKLRELTTIGDNDFLWGLARLRAEGFNLLDNIHAFYNGSEDDVSAVQPRSLHGGDEKLGSIGVGASVGHGQDSRAGVLEDEVLVSKLLTVDGLSTSAIVVCEVTSLQHEVGDHPVEGRVLVAKTLLAGAQGAEVFTGLGGDICS